MNDNSVNETAQRLYKSYLTGFVLSAGVTLLAYVLAVNQLVTGWRLAIYLLGLAIVQFAIQLFFFLHIGQEKKPRWRALTLLFLFIFAMIVIVGSIWIMYNLDTRMMPSAMTQYMQDQGGF